MEFHKNCKTPPEQHRGRFPGHHHRLHPDVDIKVQARPRSSKRRQPDNLYAGMMRPYRLATGTLLPQPLLRQTIPSRAFLDIQNTTKSRLSTISRTRHAALPTSSTSRTFRARLSYLRSLFQSTTRRHASTNSKPPTPDVTSQLGSPEPALSLSQRMRKLSREYGWSAFGVYMGLSALDFPFCFLAVRLLGTDRIGHWEHVVVSGLKRLVGMDTMAPAGSGEVPAGHPARREGAGAGTSEDDSNWGLEEAEKEAKKDSASMYARVQDFGECANVCPLQLSGHNLRSHTQFTSHSYSFACR